LYEVNAGCQSKGKETGLNSPFGVLEFLHWDFQWANYKYADEEDLKKSLALMKEAGVSWVRMDFLWQDIEPKDEEFVFEKYDRIVELAYQNGINILGLFDYNSGWDAPSGKWNCPPKDNKLFADYAVHVIRRYKNKIKYWEVWNEPDSATYWSIQDGLKSYCALLKEVYIAAKKEDPGCMILNGGFANGISSVNKLYENGAKDYFDIMNIHVFPYPYGKNAIKAATNYAKITYKIMTKNGDSHKKIWITEIGCPGVKKGIKTQNWWMGKNPTEGEQAQWVKEVYTELLKDKNVEKVFWAFFRDCDRHWCDGVDYFGLIRWDFSRKPAFEAYKKCVDEWKK
jgi:hypothetical protein